MHGLMQKVTAGVVSVIYSKYTEGPGAAFGLIEDGTKVFISPKNFREGYVPEVGDTVELIIVPNHPEHRDKTDFKAVSCKFIGSLEATTPENIIQVNKSFWSVEIFRFKNQIINQSSKNFNKFI